MHNVQSIIVDVVNTTARYHGKYSIHAQIIHRMHARLNAPTKQYIMAPQIRKARAYTILFGSIIYYHTLY